MITQKFSLHNKKFQTAAFFSSDLENIVLFLDIYFIMFYNYYVFYKKIFVIKFLLYHWGLFLMKTTISEISSFQEQMKNLSSKNLTKTSQSMTDISNQAQESVGLLTEAVSKFKV